ncbi:glycoside hydrolase family 3 protein [Streptomyces sp. URMC 129]|uniref:glycoside hydrolase family 3 protein n=1 Tax=Streptomyces sp. URMC 129 TaxID=3423407 RepID=UPI003F1A03AC
MTIAAHAADTLTRDALAVLQPAFTGTTTAPPWLLRQLENGMTGVGLFGRNVVSPGQLAGLTAQLRRANPDVLVAIDEEGGDVTRLEVRTGSSFPGNLALGSVDDPGLTRAVAAELGRRLRAVGVTLNWAPDADINTDPRNPVIGVRSFGADPALVARHTVAYVEGLQSAGVAACVKHFPGHGDTSVDSHLALPRVDTDLATLHARELVPFKAAVAAGARSVMSAHILLPALDPDRPGTLSPAVLTGLLRAPESAGGLGFQGLIFSDALEMRAVAGTYGLDRGCVLAVAAGADAVCVGGTPSDEAEVLRLRDALVRAVRAGELSEERLHDAAERVRALARWTTAARRDTAGGTPAPAGDVGLTAARRAVRVTPAPGAGPYAPPTGPAQVAVLTPAVNIAVGADTPWGVAAELVRLLPGTRAGTFGRGDAERAGPGALAARVLDAAAGRPLVVVVRDVHRHPWMAAVLGALLAARPDAVVVEMGVPHAPPAGRLHLATHGAARVCALAAAEIITGRLTTQP